MALLSLRMLCFLFFGLCFVCVFGLCALNQVSRSGVIYGAASCL